jgi:hypothetical protein
MTAAGLPVDPHHLDRKLAGLEQLRIAGLISDARYQAQRAGLLQRLQDEAGAPPGPPPPPASQAPPSPPPPPAYGIIQPPPPPPDHATTPPPPPPPDHATLPPPPTGPPLGPPGWAPQAPPARSRSGRSRLVVTAAGAVVAVAALSLYVAVGQSAGSNGEWSHSGQQVVSDARTSLLSATAVHLTGTLVTGRETNVYDITEGPHSAIGTVTSNGAVVNIRLVGSDIYMQGHQFFSNFAGPEAGAAIGERWVKGSVDDPDLAPLGPAQLSTLAQLFTTSGRGSIGKGHTTSINGVTVGTLEASNGTMGVALDGKAYPHSFSGTLSAGSLTAKVDFTLSGFDLPLPEVTAPGMSLALPSSPTT